MPTRLSVLRGTRLPERVILHGQRQVIKKTHSVVLSRYRVFEIDIFASKISAISIFLAERLLV